MNFKSINDEMEIEPLFDEHPYRSPELTRTFTVTFVGKTDIDQGAVDALLAMAQEQAQQESEWSRFDALVEILACKAEIALAALSAVMNTQRKRR